MEAYETYIFEKSNNKTVENERYVLYIILAILFVILLALLNFPGIGLFAVVAVAVGLFNVKIADDKKKGLKRFGHLRAKLVISSNSINLRNQEIPFQSLKNLEIIAKDYYGRPKNLIGYSIGADNIIRFDLNGRTEELHFLIRSRKELAQVVELVNEIKSRRTK